MDFIALGRSLIADPQWVEKLARGEPIRRCLACNTCINDMRGGARIGCVVNGVTGRELMFANPKPPRGERIAVIGAGPAGLTYASLVAAGNDVTVFEKARRPGRRVPSCRQGAVVSGGRGERAELRTLHRRSRRSLRQQRALCSVAGPMSPPGPRCSHPSTASSSPPALHTGSGSDRSRPRCSIAAPAAGPASPGCFHAPTVRDWFYYRARTATAERFTRLVKPGQIAVAIGDAVSPGKSKQAIAAAFEAALLGDRRISPNATDPP